MTPRRPTRTVLVRILARMVDFAAREGMNRQALIDGAGLTDVDLAAGDARVPVSTQVALWHLITNGITDPGFGIRMGASLAARELGLLGYVMAYSATLGAAIERLVRYSRVLNDAVEYTLERPKPEHVAVTQRHPDLASEIRYAVDFRLAALVSVCREITGAEIVPVEVSFVYEHRGDTLEHGRFFRCPLQFGQSVSRVTLLERDLHSRVRQSDEALAGYLTENAEHVLRSLMTGSSLTERVRSAIWNTLSDGRPTLPSIASALQLPPRTLQRRLAAEGTSLQREVEEVRKAMAIAMLRDPAMSTGEIAFLLGYAEPGTLLRSFRRWTGKTPHQYRKEPV